jgi:hypothetical protein
MAVYVFCRNAQSKPHSDPRDVCTLSLLYQLPNCNWFAQHVLFILWRDTTSELWTPIQFPLHCYTVYITRTVYFTCITIIQLPLDTLIPLFTANRWDWHPHHKLGSKYLFVLCAGFTLLLDKEAPTHQQVVWRHLECREASKHHLLKFGSLLLDWLPWFHNWGKTCCCAHHTFPWGSQQVGHLHHQHCTITSSSTWLFGTKTLWTLLLPPLVLTWGPRFSLLGVVHINLDMLFSILLIRSHL